MILLGHIFIETEGKNSSRLTDFPIQISVKKKNKMGNHFSYNNNSPTLVIHHE